MAYRIELTFVGDAPEGELERAKILAGANVSGAIEGLSIALSQAGLEHTVRAQTVRSTERSKNSGRKPKLIQTDAAE